MKRKYDMTKDTPILPWIVADTVLDEVQACFPLDLPDGGREMANRLSDQAERIYAANARFRKHIRARGNQGREYLRMFMRHWASAEIQECCPQVYRQLPDDFKMGRPLRCGK